MTDIREWLNRAGFSEYADTFERERVEVADLDDLTDADLSGITSEEEDLINQIANFLLNRQRSLIKSRGVPNLYVPHPAEPDPPAIIIEREKFDLEPMLRLEDLEPDFLKKIEEDADELLTPTP